MKSTILERIPVEIFSDETEELSLKVAQIIAIKIKENNLKQKNTVLGLATGNSPLNVYRELIRLHKQEGLDFSNVITFNLDEYYGLGPEHINSYYQFMWENFFNHININKKNVHIPDGIISKEKLEEYCRKYELAIKKANGIDIQLLGIGRDGHIGFNEPGSKMDTRTRLIQLDEITRIDALPDFGERKYVPKEAITIGVATIIDAKQIILMATGDHKSEIIQKVVEGEINEQVVASYLQSHLNTRIFLDCAAASRLIRVSTPWAFDGIDWSNKSLRVKAVTYLSEKLNIPVSQLTQYNFLSNSLGTLIEKYSLGNLISEVLVILKNKIADHDMLPKSKKILIFSPHPDDDIISMGGTLRKLVENKNEVYIAYMTPGYTAVFDHAVQNFITSIKLFYMYLGKDFKDLDFKKITDFFEKKNDSKYGMNDISEVLNIKKIIRESEAISVCEFLGVKKYLFLNLPFYQTGRARKMPVGKEDVAIVKKAIGDYQPDIIFAAGDLTDPNGTHRMCLKAINLALDNYDFDCNKNNDKLNSNSNSNNKLEMWIYRGAWQEFHPSEADILVPLTEQEVALKREGIFRHESQKDRPPQPGHGKGEFWQRAELRNSNTAKKCALYGIGEYTAMEAFRIIKKQG